MPYYAHTQRNYMGKWLDNQHTGECLDKTRKQKQKQREGEGEGAGEGEGEGENKSVSESERKSPGTRRAAASGNLWRALRAYSEDHRGL